MPSDHDVPVVIVGAGPVGLSLALALARHGVRSTLLERKASTSEHSKAPGIHVRTREAFRRWGVEEQVLAAGALRRDLTLHDVTTGRPLFGIDFGRLDREARRPGLLVLEQGDTERLLLEAVRASGWCDVRFGAEAVAIQQAEHGVEVTVRQAGADSSLRSAYLVGCDGASSTVRQALGWGFDGITYEMRPLLADVKIVDTRDALPWPRVRNASDGLTVGIRLRAGLWRIIRLEPGEPEADEVSDAEVHRHVTAVLGPGSGRPPPSGRQKPVNGDVVWASRFRIHRRSAPRFRKGRVLLAGDAAHVHSPIGGQGMNAGIQDADNLAWKLAAVLAGDDADPLLDSYDVERRGVVVGDVSRFTDVATRLYLQAPAPLRAAAFALLAAALRVPRLQRRAARRAAMLDLVTPPSPLLHDADRAAGVRLPNPAVRRADGQALRLYDALPLGAALLQVSGRHAVTVIPVGRAPLGERLSDDLLGLALRRAGQEGSPSPAHHDPSGVLAALLGASDGWILVRPDACVAWARTERKGLPEAVRRALGRT